MKVSCNYVVLLKAYNVSFHKNYIYDTFIVSVAKLRWLMRQSNLGSVVKKNGHLLWHTLYNSRREYNVKHRG